LVGVNGAGKTTLLSLMAGKLEQDSGKIKRGKTVVMATLSQDVRELDEFANDKIFELIAREKTYFRVDKKEVNISQLVEQLGFSSAQLQTPVGELSGGQRRRLQLLRLLFGEPNVLILDEPTNDLDTDMLAAIEGLLDSWPGTLIVVSHDRYLLERVTDMQYALLGDGHLRHLPGGVDEYLRLRKHSLGQVKSGDGRLPGGLNSSAGNSANSGSNAGGTAKPAANPNALPAGSAARRDAEKNLARIERILEKISNEEAALHIKMATFDQNDFAGLAELVAQQQAFNTKREGLEIEWLEATELLS
jgi:ABC-type branched-subunit amino acid transport system ATPase component